MKKLILSLVAVAALGAALPATAQVVIGENHRGNVVVRAPGVAIGRVDHHHRHRYAYFDRHHHRHYGWR
jgi:hypothetical protein